MLPFAGMSIYTFGGQWPCPQNDGIGPFPVGAGLTGRGLQASHSKLTTPSRHQSAQSPDLPPLQPAGDRDHGSWHVARINHGDGGALAAAPTEEKQQGETRPCCKGTVTRNKPELTAEVLLEDKPSDE